MYARYHIQLFKKKNDSSCQSASQIPSLIFTSPLPWTGEKEATTTTMTLLPPNEKRRIKEREANQLSQTYPPTHSNQGPKCHPNLPLSTQK